MNSKMRSFFLILGDYLIFNLSMWITIIVIRQNDSSDYLARHLEIFPGLFLVWILFFYIEGLYSLRSTILRSLSLSLSRALGLSILSSFLVFYFIPFSTLTPKRNLVLIGLVSFFLTYFWHYFIRKIISSHRFKIKTCLLGDVTTTDRLIKDLELRPYLGFEIIGKTRDISDLPLESSDLIVVDRQQLKSNRVADQLIELLGQNKVLMEMTQFAEIVSGKVPISAIDSSWFLEVCGKPKGFLSNLSKNVIDKSVALLLSVLVFIIYLFLIPFLLIFSGRPIFFSQTRTGYLGKSFTIYKLRTMIKEAEKDGAKWATPGDARITPIGSFLRKTRLDELPQLWNILKGDMSLVGPRPERPEFIETVLSKEIPFYNQRHLAKPGVTGWAQVNFRYGYSNEDALEKLQYDLYYVKNQNFWLDLRIILKTIKTVLTGAGQ